MKTNWLIKSSLVCVFLFLSPAFVLADTLVSGPIFGDVTWTLAQSPYEVVANIIVMSGSSLTIQPGVIVRFDGTNAMQIDGKLVARGASSQPITFTPSGTNTWGFIYFRTGSVDAVYDGGGNYLSGSILEYCTIEKGGGAVVSNNGAVRLEDAHPFINHCTIRNNSAAGVYAWSLSGTLRVKYCEINNNANTGIATSGSGSVSLAISDCSVTENTNGGISANGGSATVINCVVEGNTKTNSPGAGICVSTSLANIHGNTITDNEAIWTSSSPASGGGVSIVASTAGTISSNLICYNTAGASGGGINVGGNITISDNVIRKNKDYDHSEAVPFCGGGIKVGGGTVNILRNVIIENESAGWGGGIYLAGGTATISNNIIGNNGAAINGGGIAVNGGVLSSVLNNAIYNNESPNGSAAYGFADNEGFSRNTITANNATSSSPAATIYVNAHPRLNNNNIFGNNALYSLWNNNSNTSADVNAVSNWWGTNNASQIEDKIYHLVDDSSKGFVNYFPFGSQIRTDCPVSPPTGLTISTTANSIILNWNANPEPDVVGYKVYWGTTEPPLYEHFASVGNTTNRTITPLPQGMYYVGVTAYDTSYNPANDDPNTILNDNQTNGNESAFASSIAFVGPDPRSLTLVHPNGGEQLVAGSYYDIMWQSTGIIGNVLIELSTNNGTSWQSIITAANDGSYSWQVPATNSNQCKIRISDASNLAITDTSNSSFTIFICNKSLPGDINKDCYVDFYDFAEIAEKWLQCGNQFDPLCNTQGGGF